MPIYEYRCDNCDHEFEAIQKISEAPLKTCPVCEKDALRKKVSAAAFRLKGGGWYETDFKSDRKRNVAGEDKAASESSKDGAKDAKDGAGKAAGEGGAAKSSDGAGKTAGEKSASESKGSSGSGSSSSKSAD